MKIKQENNTKVGGENEKMFRSSTSKHIKLGLVIFAIAAVWAVMPA